MASSGGQRYKGKYYSAKAIRELPAAVQAEMRAAREAKRASRGVEISGVHFGMGSRDSQVQRGLNRIRELRTQEQGVWQDARNVRGLSRRLRAEDEARAEYARLKSEEQRLRRYMNANFGTDLPLD